MERTLTVVFDGEVFRPAEPIDLEPNVSYVIRIVSPTPAESPPKDLWDALDRMSGRYEGPIDWSSEHDHYLYGTPKRGDGTIK